MDRKMILSMFVMALFLNTSPLVLRGDSKSQQIDKRKCPTVEVKGPSKSKAFRNISYRAKVKNFSGATLPIFKWSLVGGRLVEGQGSDVITVQPRALNVRATLVIENFPVGCDSNSDTVVTRLKDIPRLDLPPMITSFKASPASIVRPCPPETKPDMCTPTGSEVQLNVDVAYPLDLDLLFTWYVTTGRLKGEGQTVTWDLSGVASGTYTVWVEAAFFNPLDERGGLHVGAGSTTVTVTACDDCKPLITMDATKL
jgi:hypothetical protein